MDTARSTLTRTEQYRLTSWLMDRKASIEAGSLGEHEAIAALAAVALGFPVTVSNIRGTCRDFEIKTTRAKAVQDGKLTRETASTIVSALVHLYNELGVAAPTDLITIFRALHPSTPPPTPSLPPSSPPPPISVAAGKATPLPSNQRR